MPEARNPFFGLRASGTLGGHRKGFRRRAFPNPTADFYPTKDTLLNAYAPNINYGGYYRLYVRVNYLDEEKSAWFRSLLNFDCSSLAGKQLLSAHLLLYADSTVGVPFTLNFSRNVQPSAWEEYQATWNAYATGFPWLVGGGDFDDLVPPVLPFSPAAGPGWKVVPGLLPHVQDALANRSGLVALNLRLVDEAPGATTGSVFYSHDAPSNHPELVVEYAP